MDNMSASIKSTQENIKPYDINCNNQLELDEAMITPAEILARQVEVLEGADLQQALSAASSLPLFKQSQLFENFSDFDVWKAPFLTLAQTSPENAAEIILQMRELPFEPGGGVIERQQGLMGALYLSILDHQTKEQVADVVVKRDPRYYQAILSISPVTISEFVRVRKFVGLATDNPTAAVRYLKKQQDSETIWVKAFHQLPWVTRDEMNERLRGNKYNPFPEKTPRPDLTYQREPEPVNGQYPMCADPQERTIYIHQKEYALAQADSQSFLQTSGLGGCAVLILWDPQKKIAAMAHIDGGPDTEDSIDLIVGDMVHNGADKSAIQAQLLGACSSSGNYWSKRTVSLIHDRLADRNIPISREDVLDQTNENKTGVTFNVNTGEAFYYLETSDNPVLSDYESPEMQFFLNQNLMERNPLSWGEPPFIVPATKK
jgi:chemotaxis receptor (MCP) glutamine deamidase CheD